MDVLAIQRGTSDPAIISPPSAAAVAITIDVDARAVNFRPRRSSVSIRFPSCDPAPSTPTASISRASLGEPEVVTA